MAGFSSLSIHDVRSIELSSFSPYNSNCRTLRITTDSGVVEVAVYGRTEGLAAVPQARNFHVTQAPLDAFDLAEAAE